MLLNENGQLMRIFVGENEKYEDRPLYEWIVLKAREKGLAGATVLRGMMGFGGKSRIHTKTMSRFKKDLPIIIELVDTTENLKNFLVSVDNVIKKELVTLEKTQVLFNKQDSIM